MLKQLVFSQKQFFKLNIFIVYARNQEQQMGILRNYLRRKKESSYLWKKKESNTILDST